VVELKIKLLEILQILQINEEKQQEDNIRLKIMEGGGTLKAMMGLLPPEKLKELIDSNRDADVLHKDKKYSPQLLVYLDNKTKDQSLNKERLTLEDARKILEQLGIEAENDSSIDMGFYGPQDTFVGSVQQTADRILRTQLTGSPSYPPEGGLELDIGRKAYAEQQRRLAKERSDADAAIKQQLSDAEQGKKVCEEELARAKAGDIAGLAQEGAEKLSAEALKQAGDVGSKATGLAGEAGEAIGETAGKVASLAGEAGEAVTGVAEAVGGAVAESIPVIGELVGAGLGLADLFTSIEDKPHIPQVATPHFVAGV
jgi:hypothetical protein